MASFTQRIGLDDDSLKSLFTAKKKKDGVTKLIRLCADRIRDGRSRALKDYRVWAAVDLAYDAPFHQETPTLIRHIMDNNSKPEDVQRAVTQWGLCESDLFCKVTQPDGKEATALNAPVFYNVLVPAVRAYTSARLSKIFNDRNLTPLFKYEPIKSTEKNRILCEIVTDIVQVISTQMGLASHLRALIFQSLVYSVCLMFPLEPWYEEKRVRSDGSKVTVRQGVRYIEPHVTRLFYDMQHPLTTFNTDTGCAYAGYWSILRWGDLERNKGEFWNLDTVPYGQNWLDTSQPWNNYFKEAYPCVLEFPVVHQHNTSNRESIADFYTTNDYDKAVFITPIFCKIVPKEFDLSDYEYPVWVRFMIAADDTVIHAKHFDYCPVVYGAYDADTTRGRNASLALEVLPFQDLLGNMLTQTFLTIKRNLANIIFYDTNMDIGGLIAELQRRTQYQYQNINLIGYDSAKLAKDGIDPRTVFHEIRFAPTSIVESVSTFNLIMMMCERMLGMSAQEIGGQASHQQSKQEVILSNASTSNRLAYTASFIDEAQDAWKKQLYDAFMAYGDADFIAQVSADIPDLETHLKELGFEIENKSGKKVTVRGKKEKLMLEGFASTREGPERGTDTAAAQAMYFAIASINNNQRLSQIADPKSIVELIEQAAKMAGANDDFKFRTTPDAATAQQLQATVEQIRQALMAEVVKEVAKPAAAAMAEQEQAISTQAKQLNDLTQLVQRLQAIINAATAAPQLPVPAQTPVIPQTANEIGNSPVAPGPVESVPGMAGQPSV